VLVLVIVLGPARWFDFDHEHEHEHENEWP
jgi:hypothetical protein